MKRTVLITGGFGYLGGRLAQFLGSESDDEIVLASRQETESPTWLPQAKAVKCEWNSSADLEQICTDVDAVVHSAGMNDLECAANPDAALEFNGVAMARSIGMERNRAGVLSNHSDQGATIDVGR